MAAIDRLDITIQRKVFPAVGQAAAHLALRDVDIAVARGEFVCVLGPSGCGKTTLLNIVAGLDADFDGQVKLPSIPDKQGPVTGYVFQDPRLLPWRTVIENIRLVLTPEQEAANHVEDLLAVAGLTSFRNAYPERLSLGLSRRAALVRAFAVQPDLLLMDEPFASLDEATAQRLRLLLIGIWKGRPTTVLFVTHNIREAIFLADRIVLMSSAPGTVIASVPVDLSRRQREDSVMLEGFRARLMRDHPSLYHQS